MCATVSVGRTPVAFRSMFLALLQSSHPGLARAPIMCSHFPHGNELVITCLARLFLASCTALELTHEPTNSRLSPSLSKNSAAQVVAAGFTGCYNFKKRFRVKKRFSCPLLEVVAYNSTPIANCPSSHFELLCLPLARFCAIQCRWSAGRLCFNCSQIDSMLSAFEIQLLL